MTQTLYAHMNKRKNRKKKRKNKKKERRDIGEKGL
jgi:hypothetical protein